MKNILMVLKPVAPHLKELIPKAPSILPTEPLLCGSHCGPSTRPGMERDLHLSEEGVFFLVSTKLPYVRCVAAFSINI